MKILHLITSLEGGGTENFLHQLVRYSPPTCSHEVFFLKKDGVIGERLRELRVIPQKISVGQLYPLLRGKKPDILHTLLYRAHQVGRVLGRVAGIKAVISSQRAIDAWQKPWHSYLDSFTLPFCDQVFVNSSAAEDLIKARIKNHSKPRITKILNGVDLQRFSRQDRVTARQKLNIPADANALIGGSLMRLHAEKGADFILAFAQKALQANPQLHLVVGGVGPMENRLRHAAKKEAWGARLHWLGWVEDTPGFYSALDFFWSLSREESFPQSLLEATVVGIPWLAPEVGGVPDLVAAGAQGMTYSVGDLQQAADSIPAVIQKKGGLLSETIRADFSVHQMAARFYQALSF